MNCVCVCVFILLFFKERKIFELVIFDLNLSFILIIINYKLLKKYL